MQFRTIGAALDSLLAAKGAGKFVVNDAQRQGLGADEITKFPVVTVMYEQGDFPKSSGGYMSLQHDMSFTLDIFVAAPAKMDLSTIDSPTATTVQIAAAIAAATSASKQADSLIDQTFEALFQILRDPRNKDLGLTSGTVANAWPGQFQKGAAEPRGEYVMLSAKWSYNFRARELAPGEVGTALASVDTAVHVTADISGAQTDPAPAGAQVGS